VIYLSPAAVSTTATIKRCYICFFEKFACYNSRSHSHLRTPCTRHFSFASEVRTFLLDVLPQPILFHGYPKSLHHALAAFCEHYRAKIEVVCYGVSVSSSSSGAAAAADGDSTISVVRLEHGTSVETLGEPEVLIRLLYDGATGSLYIVKFHAQRHSARSAGAAAAAADVVGGRPKRPEEHQGTAPDSKRSRRQSQSREGGAAGGKPQTRSARAPNRRSDGQETNPSKKSGPPKATWGPLPDPPPYSGFMVQRSLNRFPGRLFYFDPKTRTNYWADEHLWKPVVRQYEEEAAKQARANRATAPQRPAYEILPEAAAILARAKGKAPAKRKSPARAAKK
jgi:hypothetical protein